MNDNLKSTFGYIILLCAVVGFVLSFIASDFLLSILFIVGGVMFWLIYINSVRASIHRSIGAILIIFGFFLSCSVFTAFGLEQDIWGGYHIKEDGTILSVVVLFFSIMPGLVFYYLSRNKLGVVPPPAQPSPKVRESKEISTKKEYVSPQDYEELEYYYEPLEYPEEYEEESEDEYAYEGEEEEE
ncbi:MAG: hypothetical protein H8E82_04260 [Candidatus Marinimicrobia bacterium]|nr:hypothetical protein [Candidatus Neomarinimicrobiota bacterium]